MGSSSAKNKKKMYLTIGLIMIIIITAWFLNLKNSLNNNQSSSQKESQKLNLDGKWDKMTTDLSNIFGNIKDLRQSLGQSPTTSATDLQNAAQINPDDLNKFIEKLKIETSTTTATSTNNQNQ